MSAALPTGSFGNWTVTKLKDSLISALAGDGRADGAKLRFYFYAVTLSGWNQLRDSVHAASVELTDKWLRSYRSQRASFESQRMRARATAFVWRARGDSHIHDDPRISAGDLVIEVMPCETGTGGKQIQLPMVAVREFFDVDDTKTITLTERDDPISRRDLTMTVYRNNTARLVIQELEYRDRPCVIVFHKVGPDQYVFEIVRESGVPRQYRRLLKEHCNFKSRSGARRWGIVNGRGR